MSSQPRRIEPTAAPEDLGGVRERLARLETRADHHEKASGERHGQVLGAIQGLGARLDAVEARTWKLSLAVVAGAGGAVGGVELVKLLVGG